MTKTKITSSRKPTAPKTNSGKISMGDNTYKQVKVEKTTCVRKRNLKVDRSPRSSPRQSILAKAGISRSTSINVRGSLLKRRLYSRRLSTTLEGCRTEGLKYRVLICARQIGHETRRRLLW